MNTTCRHIYVWLAGTLRRFRDDERGAATAEQIVGIAAAVVGAAIIAGIIWSRLQSGAEQIQVPVP